MIAQKMFAPLTPQEQEAAPFVANDSSQKSVLWPVPSYAPDMTFKHPKFGTPSQSWAYRDAEGGLLGYIARFDHLADDGTNAKTYQPITFCELGNGKSGWRSKGFPTPRPLYNLDKLSARPDAPVIVTEGEKAADAASILFPDYVATTPPHGAQSPHLTDWSALAGRHVVISPDHDEPGQAFADKVYSLLNEVGAASVKLLSADRLNPNPPPGFDLADAMAEDWTAEKIAQRLSDPGFIRFYLDATARAALQDDLDGLAGYEHGEEPVAAIKAAYEWPFRVSKKGVEKRVDKKDPDGETVTDWRWVCSQLEITARTRTADSTSWGTLVRFADRDGVEHTLVISDGLVEGDDLELRRLLAHHGLRMSRAKSTRDAIGDYISTASQDKRVRCVSSIGWHGDSFVMHKETIGATDQEEVLFQTDHAVKDPFDVSGTLQDWQDQIAIHARGNSRLMFALSAGLAGPLMHLTGTEGGGFHFVGKSSSGKSTLLKCGASLWGKGSASGSVNSWRTTDNALESTCAGRSDTLLCLDELKEADPKTVAASVYMIANGSAKARSNRSGGLRSQPTWRALVLSNGEMSIKAKLNEAGESYPAGIAVRFLEIAAETGTPHKVFETVHGFADGAALSQHLTDAATKYHGTASRAFLKALTADLKRATAKADGIIAEFVAGTIPQGADGQVHRAARRFGLVAAAGELGIEFGVLPWPEGHAVRASAKLFKEWMGARGGVGSAEEAEHLATVRRFIELHGTSRFEPMGALIPTDGAGEPLGARIINRAGYRRTHSDAGDIEYLVTPEAWRSEVCKGLDASAVAKTLLARGMIDGDTSGRPQKLVRLPGNGNASRVFVVTSKLFEDA